MTKLVYLALQQLIKEKAPDNTVAKKAASIALGVAVSRLLPVPSSQVESAEEHYSANVIAGASDMVSTFNEEIVVDIDLALETARGFWLIRYFNAYPQQDYLVTAGGEACFLLKLSGSVRYLNADTGAFCDANSEMMITLVNRITSAIHQPTITEVDETPTLRRG